MKLKMPLGGAFGSSPGEPLLPATDGSNCAETQASRALIIYAVCCMLLSKVPCSTVSAYIFGMSGLGRGGTVCLSAGIMNPLIFSTSAGRRSMVQKT